MKKKQPIIVKMIRFANGNNSHWRYYQSGDYINYILRDRASWINPEENKTALFNINNDNFYDWNELQDLKNKFHELNPKQNVWDFVISFEKEFMQEKIIDHPELISGLIKEPLQELFKKNYMNIEDYEVFFALHENTDNKHIHLAFFEKEATNYNIKTNQPIFKYKGLLANSETKELKEFAQDILKETDSKYYAMMIDYRKQVVQMSRMLLRQNLNDEYGKLVSTFIEKDIHTFKFKNLDEDTQNQVLDLENKLVNSNQELKKCYQEYFNTLNQIYEIKQTRNEAYNMQNKNTDLNNWLEQEKDDLNVRIANGILKEIKNSIPFETEENTAEDSLLKNIEEDIKQKQSFKIQKAMVSIAKNPGNTVDYLNKMDYEKNYKQYSTSNNLNKTLKVLKDVFEQMNKDAINAYKKLMQEIENEMSKG